MTRHSLYSVSIPPRGRGGPVHVAGGRLYRDGRWSGYAYDPKTDETYSIDAESWDEVVSLTRDALGWDPFSCDSATVVWDD